MRSSKQISLLLFLAGTLLLASSCASKKFFTFNPRHSINIAIVEKDWPGDPKKTLSVAQQEVFEKRGAPDFIRFWWNGSDNFPTNIDPRTLEKEQIAATKQSWIYVRQGDEVIFDNSFSSRSIPIGGKLAIVIKEGDPEERNVTQDEASGEVEERWLYYNTGREYRFHGDTMYSSRQVSDPMQAFLKG